MKKLRPFLTAVCLAVFIITGYLTVTELVEQRQTEKDFHALAELVKTENVPAAPTGPQTIDVPKVPAPLPSTRDLTPLFEKNPDCVGWLYIEGTAVDYAVMHTPQEPQKYLRRNFDGAYSHAGIPFLDGRCTPNDDHLIIYGHNMKNGTMFSDITRYQNEAYCTEHPMIEFETAQGLKQYAVFAAVSMDENDSWYQFLTAVDENEYDVKVAEAKSRSLYAIDLTPSYGQQLLTLSTCHGETESDRLVIIAAEVAP